MYKKTIFLLTIIFSCGSIYAQSISNNKITKSQHLALACLACHSSPDLPNLHSIPKPLLEKKLHEYAQEKIQATIMHKILKGYSDIQLQEIANYFSEEK